MSFLTKRREDDDVEEVDGVLCWDPETGPVGPGPYEPQPATYEVYEGRDGRLKIAPIRRTDDGEQRYEWDDATQAYKRAMRGEQATSRGPRPKHIFVPEGGDVLNALKEQFKDITQADIARMMKKYGL